MKWVGEDFIIHGLFVDDMQHTSTSQALMDEFMHTPGISRSPEERS
jgi:hypothetical protein